MGLAKRDKFIDRFLVVLKKDLEEKLPDSDFEMDMLRKAYDIIEDKIKHIKAVLNGRSS